jgi:4-amino-4-deoxyprephenate dehydrogenase
LPETLIAGVSGKMGGVLAAGLAGSGMTVAGIDLRHAAHHPHCQEYRQADLTQPGQAAALQDLFAGSRWCILCLPEGACLEFVPSLLEMVSPGALIVDTLSIKTPLQRVYDGHAGLIASKDLEILGINPLFSPELGFAGRTTLAVQRSARESGAAFLRLLSEWGTRVVRVDEAEHDERMALVQGLTHATIIAFGLTLQRMGYQWSEFLDMMTPPHAVLVSLLARALTLNPEVYWDIQHGNPHAARVRQELMQSLAALDRVVTGADLTGFSTALETIAACLQPGLPDLAAWCGEQFSALGTMRAARPHPSAQ